MTGTDKQLKFSRVSKDDDSTIAALAQKYRCLRLISLKLSPESFASTLAIESQYDQSVWQERLRRPGFETFICAVLTQSNSVSTSRVCDLTSDETTWVAQVTLHGPISHSDFELPVASGQRQPTAEESRTEERWQVLSLYVHPGYRGHAVAQQICSSAFDYLMAERFQRNGALKQLSLRAMVKPDNVASIALFKRKLSFKESGRCTLPEALVANGDVVPEDMDEEVYTRRKGWILSRVIRK